MIEPHPNPALQNLQFASLLDSQAIEALRRLAKSVFFVSGTLVMRQGQAAKGAMFIESGEVEVRVALPGGGELPVACLGPGNILGEMALLEQGIVSATVIARTGVNGLLVERDDFRALIAQRDEAVIKFQHAITLMLARKLRALNAKVLACDTPGDPPAGDNLLADDPLDGVPRKRSASFDYRRFLPLLELFREFGEEDIDQVVARAKLLELPRGHGVFAAGQPVSASYVIVRGAIEVSALRVPPEGGRGEARWRRIAVLGPGEWVGVISQLDGIIHGSSGRTRENTLLLEIDRTAFESLYRTSSATSAKIQRAINRSLLRSLRRTNNHLARLISQAHIRGHRDTLPVHELQSALYGQLCHVVFNPLAEGVPLQR